MWPVTCEPWEKRRCSGCGGEDALQENIFGTGDGSSQVEFKIHRKSHKPSYSFFAINFVLKQSQTYRIVVCIVPKKKPF